MATTFGISKTITLVSGVAQEINVTSSIGAQGASFRLFIKNLDLSSVLVGFKPLIASGGTAAAIYGDDTTHLGPMGVEDIPWYPLISLVSNGDCKVELRYSRGDL